MYIVFGNTAKANFAKSYNQQVTSMNVHPQWEMSNTEVKNRIGSLKTKLAQTDIRIAQIECMHTFLYLNHLATAVYIKWYVV